MLETRSKNHGKYPSRGIKLLRLALRKKGWSQGELARELGCHSGHVNKWLHGVQRPGRAFALKLEEVLEIPAESWNPVRLSATGTEG